MRSAIIYSLLLSLSLISGCTDKVHIFRKHTDVEEAGLKGRVRSITRYQCSLDSSGREHCNVWIRKFNAQGFKVEVLDTSGHDFFTTKYSYNSDGLLTKLIFSGSAPFSPSETTYMYSCDERKKTTVIHTFGSSSMSTDSSVTIYDKNGNEIEYSGGDTKWINKYDKYGFRIWNKFTRDTETIETVYTNDDQGRILKEKRSDGFTFTHAYNKEGNAIRDTWVDKEGKVSDYFIGYCEFDKNGNHLKSIDFCPQTKDMGITRQIIEYY